MANWLATQPCPCGYYTEPARECTCNAVQIQRYMSKTSAPLFDRIDIQIEVPAVKYKELSSENKGEKSETIRERVVAGRKVQLKRFEKLHNVFNNADMRSKEIREYCRLDTASVELFKMEMQNLVSPPALMTGY